MNEITKEIEINRYMIIGILKYLGLKNKEIDEYIKVANDIYDKKIKEESEKKKDE